jgi:prevent-host-death family protein
MLRIIGVTELQRRFRAVFDEVVEQQTPVVLTRGSRPEAVLISYQEYLRLQQLQADEDMAHFDRVWERLARLNAGVDTAELAADIEAARQGNDARGA